MLMRSPLARERKRPPGFILPCQPTPADAVPAGPQWIHELKHDGFRVMARKDGDAVRLWSRNGRCWSAEFAAIAAAIRALPYRSIILDGEAVAHCPEGLPDFWRLHARDGQASACLYAFDLLDVDGEDLRKRPLGERRERLAAITSICAPPQTDGATHACATSSILFSEHLPAADGPALYRHACAMGLEGIVSKRVDRPYKPGSCRHWVKVRNPEYVRRDAG